MLISHLRNKPFAESTTSIYELSTKDKGITGNCCIMQTIIHRPSSKNKQKKIINIASAEKCETSKVQYHKHYCAYKSVVSLGVSDQCLSRVQYFPVTSENQCCHVKAARLHKENAKWALTRRPPHVSAISHQSCDPGGSEFDEGSSFVSAVEGANRYVSYRNEIKFLSYFSVPVIDNLAAAPVKLP